MKRYRDGVLVDIPPDEAEEIQAEIAAMVEPVPPAVELWKARVVMAQTPDPKGVAPNLLEAVKALVQSLPDSSLKTAATEGFERANMLSRHGVMVTTLAPQLELDAEALDALFRQARAIQG